MIEQLPHGCVLRQQHDDAADQTQLGACPPTRAYAAQQPGAVGALKQRASHHRHHQQRESHEQEQPRPRLEALDVRLREAEQPLRVAQALLAREAAGILSRHPHGRQREVREQVPHAAPPLWVARPRLRHEDVARVAFAVSEPAPRATALVGAPRQGAEFPPSAFDTHFVARLGADAVRNAQLVEQVEQVHVGEPAVGRQDEAAVLDAPEQVVKEQAHELPLVAAHPLFQLRVVLGAPENRDDPTADT